MNDLDVILLDAQALQAAIAASRPHSRWRLILKVRRLRPDIECRVWNKGGHTWFSLGPVETGVGDRL